MIRKSGVIPGTIVDQFGRRAGGPAPEMPSLLDQVTAGINFINYQIEAQNQATLVKHHRDHWIREWESRRTQ